MCSYKMKANGTRTMCNYEEFEWPSNAVYSEHHSSLFKYFPFSKILHVFFSMKDFYADRFFRSCK